MTNRTLHMKVSALKASRTAGRMAARTAVGLTLSVAALNAFLPGPAEAARAFVKEIEAQAAAPRPPGASYLDVPALAACLTRARDLEKAGSQLDLDSAEIDRLAAMAAMMGRGIDLGAAMAPSDDQDGADSMAKLHKRFVDYDAMATRFQEASKAQVAKVAEYDKRVHAFEAECDKAVRPDDLIEAKRSLGWK